MSQSTTKPMGAHTFNGHGNKIGHLYTILSLMFDMIARLACVNTEISCNQRQ
jgi:hypothetical protein